MTYQMVDLIEYQGQTWGLAETPFGRLDRWADDLAVSTSTAARRGYVARWKLDDALHLTGFDGDYSRVRDSMVITDIRGSALLPVLPDGWSSASTTVGFVYGAPTEMHEQLLVARRDSHWFHFPDQRLFLDVPMRDDLPPDVSVHVAESHHTPALVAATLSLQQLVHRPPATFPIRRLPGLRFRAQEHAPAGCATGPFPVLRSDDGAVIEGARGFLLSERRLEWAEFHDLDVEGEFYRTLEIRDVMPHAGPGPMLAEWYSGDLTLLDLDALQAAIRRDARVPPREHWAGATEHVLHVQSGIVSPAEGRSMDQSSPPSSGS